jgi:hypothetical protein
MESFIPESGLGCTIFSCSIPIASPCGPTHATTGCSGKKPVKTLQLSYKPQLKNCRKALEADPMGKWKGFWNLAVFTWKVKAKVDCGGNAAADVSG